MKRPVHCSRTRGPYQKRRPESAGPILGLLFLLLGVIFSLVPGVRFTGVFLCCLSIAVFLWVGLDHFSRVSRLFRICKVIYLASVCCLLTLLIPLEVQVLCHSDGDDPHTPVSAVIVLGAGVNGETPSLCLQSRIDAAAAYLNAHPGTPAVLSGGKGAGEQISEAEAMRRELEAQGIPSELLWLEERSVNTAENFLFSAQVLDAHQVNPRGSLAVITSDFHLFRAKLLATRADMSEPVGIPARTPWWLRGNYFLREAFATVKTMLFS